MEETKEARPSKSEEELEKPERDIQILSDLYSKHHLTGNRRNQSVSEEKRSKLFKVFMEKLLNSYIRVLNIKNGKN